MVSWRVWAADQGLDFRGAFELGDGPAGGVEDFAGDGGRWRDCLSAFCRSVWTWTVAGAIWDVVGELAINKSAVGREVERAGFDQPDMAVDAGAFIKPALELRGIDPNGQRVVPAAIGQVGDVVAKAAVAAFVMADQVAVEEDAAIAINAVELQSEAAALIRLRQREGRRYQATLFEW